MAWVTIVLLALLPFVSQTEAITACKYSVVNRVERQQSLIADAASYLSGQTLWVPMMIESDGYTFASRKYTFGKLSSKSLTASISTKSTNGKNTTVPYNFFTVTSNTSLSVLDPDGHYDIYVFKCSDNMMGVYRCKLGNLNGDAQLFTFARTSESYKEITGEIAECTKRMKNVDSYFHPKRMAHPDE